MNNLDAILTSSLMTVIGIVFVVLALASGTTLRGRFSREPGAPISLVGRGALFVVGVAALWKGLSHWV